MKSTLFVINQVLIIKTTINLGLFATRYVKLEVGTARWNKCVNFVDLRFEMITRITINVNDVQKCQMFHFHYETTKLFEWQNKLLKQFLES